MRIRITKERFRSRTRRTLENIDLPLLVAIEFIIAGMKERDQIDVVWYIDQSKSLDRLDRGECVAPSNAALELDATQRVVEERIAQPNGVSLDHSTEVQGNLSIPAVQCTGLLKEWI
ncbi:hypothetical protein EVAR_88067_1 [Eumeta japonica]|uniref:Uncharacterized protein n=1 Tax=Eumeta variegata TaxID=151549 RepID=A0A4C1WI86_EUMVA|nr:hypothetical protein EVAR_88067_1 [Eumeta japonica]